MSSDLRPIQPQKNRPGHRRQTKSVAGEPLSVGVPLARLIKRRLIESPEIVMLSQKRSVCAERFRRLRTLLVNQDDSPAQVIVVTSGMPEEGKSTVAINLALAFAAEKGERTLLIDCDLRRPAVGRWLRPEPRLGLAEVLTGQITIEHAILGLENSLLEVLPAGGPVDNPTELLSSEATGDVIEDLRKRFGRVIIDTPPIVPFTDADTVGSHTDGVVVVARANRTPRSLLREALSAITSTLVLGTVFNDVTYTIADSNRYYGNYYDRYYSREEAPKGGGNAG
jgi:receptor protein-tyrosine kinase